MCGITLRKGRTRARFPARSGCTSAWRSKARRRSLHTTCNTHACTRICFTVCARRTMGWSRCPRRRVMTPGRCTSIHQEKSSWTSSRWDTASRAFTKQWRESCLFDSSNSLGILYQRGCVVPLAVTLIKIPGYSSSLWAVFLNERLIYYFCPCDLFRWSFFGALFAATFHLFFIKVMVGRELFFII